MQIQVNTDNHIRGNAELTSQVQSVVESALGRFADRITRVQVNLSDENSAKGGEDKKCAMEARAAGLNPMAATHKAATLDQAIIGAAEKLERVLESALGRLDEKKGRTPMGGAGVE